MKLFEAQSTLKTENAENDTPENVEETMHALEGAGQHAKYK
jgi:hypothetical protein